MKTFDQILNPGQNTCQTAGEAREFTCRYCNKEVSSDRLYGNTTQPNSAGKGDIFLCPECSGPNYISDKDPATLPGTNFDVYNFDIPDDLKMLYNQAYDYWQNRQPSRSVEQSYEILQNIMFNIEDGKLDEDNYCKYMGDVTNFREAFRKMGEMIENSRLAHDSKFDARHEIDLDDAANILKFTEMMIGMTFRKLQSGNN